MDGERIMYPQGPAKFKLHDTVKVIDKSLSQLFHKYKIGDLVKINKVVVSGAGFIYQLEDDPYMYDEDQLELYHSLIYRLINPYLEPLPESKPLDKELRTTCNCDWREVYMNGCKVHK